MISEVERKYCEKCPSSSSCGYISRELESKCEQLSTYMDGYEVGIFEGKKQSGDKIVETPGLGHVNLSELERIAKPRSFSQKGYIARDSDGSLFFYEKCPKRFHEDSFRYWSGGGRGFPILDPVKAFPNLKWKNEPVEVKLTIEQITN